MRTVKREPHDGRESRRLHRIAETSDVLFRETDSHSCSKDIGRQLADALHRRRAARDHYAAVETLRETAALDLAQDEVEDLVHPLVDNVRQHLTLNVPLALRYCAGQLENVLRINQRLVGAPVSLLQSLRVGLRNADSLHDVARDVVPAVVDGPKVTNLPLVENRNVSRAGTQLDESDAELFLVFSENAERARQRLEDELANMVSRSLD